MSRADMPVQHRPLVIAFIAPQGTLVLNDYQYRSCQDCMAEGGSHTSYVVEMARALASRGGHQVDIITRNYGQIKQVEVEADYFPVYVRVIRVPTSAPPGNERDNFYMYYPDYLARLIQLVDSNVHVEYDCIVGHNADSMALAVALGRHLSIKYNRQLPVIGVAHSLALEALNPSNAKRVLLKPTQPAALRRQHACELASMKHLDGMVVLSRNQELLLKTGYDYPPNRLIGIFPGGVDEKIFCKLPRRSRIAEISDLTETDKSIPKQVVLNLESGRLVFGFGRVTMYKGLNNAVKAIGHLLKNHPTAVYVYAGGDPAYANAEERRIQQACMSLAKEGGYEDRVLFIGHRSQEDIARWLNLCDVYLHCALRQSYGLAIVEAAACGAAVVMSRNAGVADTLVNNYNVLLHDPKLAEDIADKLDQILSGTRVQVMGVRPKLTGPLSWWKSGEGLSSFIAEVLSMPRVLRGIGCGYAEDDPRYREYLLEAVAGYDWGAVASSDVPRVSEALAILHPLLRGRHI